MVYINFAYKLTPPEQATPDQRGSSALTQIPDWVRDGEFFDIEARAEGNPTKDQMRLMMRALLQERFKLAAHFESRELPVLALTLVRPGRPGSKLRSHAEGPRCPDSYLSPETTTSANAPDVFPRNCGTPGARQISGLRQVGARDMTMSSIANTLYLTGAMAGEIDRPVIDQSGLSGTFDFLIEFKPGEGDRLGPPAAVDGDPPPSNGRTTPFLDAIRDQLGLRLVSSKGPVRKLVIDHIERPSEN